MNAGKLFIADSISLKCDQSGGRVESASQILY
jgi:hypothetical protein